MYSSVAHLARVVFKYENWKITVKHTSLMQAFLFSNALEFFIQQTIVLCENYMK